MRRQPRSATEPRKSTQRGRRIACRQCRQAKIRCDLSSGGTTPCSRCQRMDRDCEIDTEFKRVNKRARLEDLEDEVRQLRSSISNFPLLDSPISVEASSSNRHRGGTALSGSDASQSAATFFQDGSAPSPNREKDYQRLSQEIVSTTTPRLLDHLRLDSAQIDSLFDIFFRRYHPFVPVLDPTVTPNCYYNRCPLLFWVVIYTASRRYSEVPGLPTAMISPMKSLMWETVANPPHNWYIVQSITLLCMWPFPTSSLSTDTTPMLINIAQTIAMQLGLHQPEAIQDFSRTKRNLNKAEISEVVKTWSVCYIASQSISSTYGMVLSSSEWVIDRVCDDEDSYAVPQSMKHQLLIYRFSARVNNFMSKDLPRPANSLRSQEIIPVLKLLECEFADLSRSIGQTLAADNEILLYATELQLSVFYLLDPGESVTRKMGLLKAFDTSKALLTKLQQMDTVSDFMRYCPATYFRMTSLAALFLLRLGHSNFADNLDVEGGKRAFNAALSLLRRASLEENDLPDRTSKILAQLWSVQGRLQQSSQEPHLKLRTRLAASLLHDELWNWREMFGGQGSASHTPLRGIVLLFQSKFTFGPFSLISYSSSFAEPVDGQIPEKGLDLQNALSLPSDPMIDRLSFEELFDVEMMSLLPFDFENEIAPNAGNFSGLLS